jgi:hypothetical protein
MSGSGTGLMSGGGLSIGSGGRGNSDDGCSSIRGQIATTLPTVSTLYAYVLVPQGRVRSNEIGHEADAAGILENFHGHTS